MVGDSYKELADRAGAEGTLGLGRAPEESALTQAFIPSQGGGPGFWQNNMYWSL